MKVNSRHHLNCISVLSARKNSHTDKAKIHIKNNKIIMKAQKSVFLAPFVQKHSTTVTIWRNIRKFMMNNSTARSQQARKLTLQVIMILWRGKAKSRAIMDLIGVLGDRQFSALYILDFFCNLAIIIVHVFRKTGS